MHQLILKSSREILIKHEENLKKLDNFHEILK